MSAATSTSVGRDGAVVSMTEVYPVPRREARATRLTPDERVGVPLGRGFEALVGGENQCAAGVSVERI